MTQEQTSPQGASGGGSWSEWFFLGLLLPLGILGLTLYAARPGLVDAFEPTGDATVHERLEAVCFPLIVVGIAWIWIPLTFVWTREHPLTRRGRVLLVALAVLPGVALALAGAVAAVVALGG